MKLMLSSILILTGGCVTIEKNNYRNPASQSLNLPTIKLENIQSLKLKSSLEPNRPPHVSAASGLVHIKDTFFVVSDDEQYIFKIKAKDENIESFAIRPGATALPFESKSRKAAKPDLESIIKLSADEWPDYGAVVAWPSCSTPARMKAYIFPFDRHGELTAPIENDVTQLCLQIIESAGMNTDDLNIEGLVLHQNKASFLKRGISDRVENGITQISRTEFLASLRSGNWVISNFLNKELKIGYLGNTKLTVTDATISNYGIIGLATAEKTKSSYDDGEIMGSVLFIIKDNGELKPLGVFERAIKLEGIAIGGYDINNRLELFLVDDADDPKKPSTLYRASISLEENKKSEPSSDKIFEQQE